MSLKPWLLPVWDTLRMRIDAQRFPHALLLTGAIGLGKRELAAALVARLLCTTPRSDGFACDLCRGCRLRTAGTHPDRVTVTLEPRDDGKLRTEVIIDQIRALGERFASRPSFGGWQVVAIDPADRMNVSAANALLKTLEEPSANTALILVADDPARLPATIRSRCQRIELRPPDPATARAWLIGQGIVATAVDEALLLADGNPGAAKSMLDADAGRMIDALISDMNDAALGSSLVAIAARWGEQDCDILFKVLARLVLLAMRASAQTQALPRVAAMTRLTAQADFRKLQVWWDHLNLARARLPTPLRKDLAIIELLDEWRAAMTAGAA
ncbi:MAG TPA: DNA polymerase III subunit delta' [Pseudomonadota bacterium]|nr:DNA polymerase III subunit delta' [Rhodanobacteraceae bacterium]MBP9153874.1 DNA polymerase III subunit delta' [Xanthomonadales bacterium]HQW81689.1 DNA polymerase III subunit delta' [Pseudomonadota bacterium]